MQYYSAMPSVTYDLLAEKRKSENKDKSKSKESKKNK
jgi:hypothetical protein